MTRNAINGAPERATYQIRALDRGLDLLEAFTVDAPELSIGQLAERTGLPKPTIVRLLSVLAERSYVERIPESERYRLGVRTLELGSVFQQTTSVESQALPIMRRLADDTRQTANLGVLDRYEVVHIAVVAPDRPVRFWASVGKREAAHVSGLGKVLLAALAPDAIEYYLQQPRPAMTPKTIVRDDDVRAEFDRIRERGYAIDDEESNPGVRCVAAPIADSRGATIAAVSISGALAEFADEMLDDLVTHVTSAASDISRRMGAAVPVR